MGDLMRHAGQGRCGYCGALTDLVESDETPRVMAPHTALGFKYACTSGEGSRYFQAVH